jgi:cytochrome c oxidase assembly protein subunit 15
MQGSVSKAGSVWPHRVAVFTALWALLVISIGGLVTSKGVGMAVPDWPTTYGYNMFFFPFEQWKLGNGGIFHEHFHRLVASGLGLLTIVLAAILQWSDRRRWVWTMGWIAVVAVVIQGVLGGKRVVLNGVDVMGIPGAVFFGVLHAALAQVFFALLLVIAWATSRPWRHWVAGGSRPVGSLASVFAILAGLTLLQLLVAASMRHQHAGLAIPDFPLAYGKLYPATDAITLGSINQRRMGIVDDAPVTAFQIHLQMVHRLLAVVLVIGVGVVYRLIRRVDPAWTLAGRVWLGLFSLQFLLGAITIWTNKAADIATAHVGVGAVTLAFGVGVTFARWAAERVGRTSIKPCGSGEWILKSPAGSPVRAAR